MKKKMRIGVIMGGISSELEISMRTGKEMLAHLNPNRYDVIPSQLLDKIIRYSLEARKRKLGGSVYGY